MSESRVAADVAAMSGGQGGEVTLPVAEPTPTPAPLPDPAPEPVADPQPEPSPSSPEPSPEPAPEPVAQPAARERNGLADRNYELRQRARNAEQQNAELRSALDRM